MGEKWDKCCGCFVFVHVARYTQDMVWAINEMGNNEAAMCWKRRIGKEIMLSKVCERIFLLCIIRMYICACASLSAKTICRGPPLPDMCMESLPPAIYESRCPTPFYLYGRSALTCSNVHELICFFFFPTPSCVVTYLAHMIISHSDIKVIPTHKDRFWTLTLHSCNLTQFPCHL